MKAFHALDGLGLKLLARAGIAVALDHRQRRAGGRAIARAQLGIAARACSAPTTSSRLGALRARARARAARRARTSATTCPTCRCSRAAASRSTVPARARRGARARALRHARATAAHGAVRELAELILRAQGHALDRTPGRAPRRRRREADGACVRRTARSLDRLAALVAGAAAGRPRRAHLLARRAGASRRPRAATAPRATTPTSIVEGFRAVDARRRRPAPQTLVGARAGTFRRRPDHRARRADASS